MIGTFAFLIGRSTRNRLVRQLQRLRQPRYLVALALGLSYLWFLVVRQRPDPSTAGPLDPRWLELAGAVLVAGLVAWSWIFAVERRALAFTPAEVTFLFPAPLSRRQLIHFKLLRSQLVILVNTLLWTLLLSRERFVAATWLRAVALWVLFTTLSLHRLGASFVRGSLAAHGSSGAARRVVSLVTLGAVLGGVVWVVMDAREPLVSAWAQGVQPFFQALGEAFQRPPARVLLAPFRAMLRPLTAASPADWSRTMLPALVLLGFHYVWVIRSDAAFEEAAAAAALKRRARGRTSEVRRARPPYRLAPRGSPGGAIVWKNLVAVARTGRPRTIALVLGAASVIAGALSFRGEGTLAEIAGWLAAMWAGFLLLVGPQWVRSDLRTDLSKLDLLKSYPISGRAVVRAEVTASALVLTALQLGLLSLAYLAFLGNRHMEPELAVRSAALAAACLCLPAVNLLGLLIHNGAAILYPAWVGPAPGRPGGVEALGQNMLALIAYALLLGVALLVPISSGVAVFAVAKGWMGWWAAVPGAVFGLAGAVGEAWMLTGWIGRAYDRMG